jgi:hypothetical protein
MSSSGHGQLIGGVHQICEKLASRKEDFLALVFTLHYSAKMLLKTTF